MNKYLEKIARGERIERYAVKRIKKHDLVETALDIKGRMDDINNLHSKFKEDKKSKKPLKIKKSVKPIKPIRMHHRHKNK